MRTHRFYKENGVWFIDLKYWPANKAHLAMVLGADKLLEVLFGDKGEGFLTFSTKKFEGYEDVLKKKSRLPGSYFNGAIYDVEKTKINHNLLDSNYKKDNLWICGVTLFVFWGIYPKNIYFKVFKK